MIKDTNQFLNLDEKNKTIYLSKGYHRDNRVSPEDAFTLLRYCGYKTSPEESIRIWDIINTVEDYDVIDEYGYCTVITEDYYNEKGMDRCFEEIRQRSLENGHLPDYILLRRKGTLNIIHNSNNIDFLRNQPYTPTPERLEDGGGSFSIGLYVLDVTHNKHLQNEDLWYTGTYHGYYYECIEDLHNGEKCGGEQINQKEFFIPRGVETIKWN